MVSGIIRRYRVTAATSATLSILFVSTALQAQAIVNLIGVGMYLTAGLWLAHRLLALVEGRAGVLKALGMTGTGVIVSVTVTSGFWFAFVAIIDWLALLASHGVGI